MAVGWTPVLMSELYSYANVCSVFFAGGTIGRINVEYAGKSIVENIYSQATVTGFQNPGGLIGQISLDFNKGNLQANINICNAYSAARVFPLNSSSFGLAQVIGNFSLNTSQTVSLSNVYFDSDLGGFPFGGGTPTIGTALGNSSCQLFSILYSFNQTVWKGATLKAEIVMPNYSNLNCSTFNPTTQSLHCL